MTALIIIAAVSLIVGFYRVYLDVVDVTRGSR